MIEQSVLPFKLGATQDSITPHAGLALLGEYAYGLKLPEQIDAQMPGPGSGAGYSASEYVFPLLLMLNGGGRSLEDLRELRSDSGLRSVLKLKEIPSSDAVGDWLRRMGRSRGLSGLGKVNESLVACGLASEDGTDYTLDQDATVIFGEKEKAEMSYKGVKGYCPLVGHLAENGLVLHEEFRAGNVSPGARNLEFLKGCQKRMPKGKRIKFFRSDSAAYQAELLDYCEEEGIKYAVGADLDEAVLEVISGIGVQEWREYGDGYISEAVHTMNKSQQAFRLIVIKRPVQGKLFAESEVRYTVIASNREERAEETVAWYNQRGECSENRLKELKLGIGMERMPCGDLRANAVFFRIGVIAYNLFRLFGLKILPEEWQRHQLGTVRWKLYNLAGKVVWHAGQLWLKVSAFYYLLFQKLRRRIYAFSYG